MDWIQTLKSSDPQATGNLWIVRNGLQTDFMCLIQEDINIYFCPFDGAETIL